jgi:lipopolysaccharide assembly outer membrane protein LptD (OstA)
LKRKLYLFQCLYLWRFIILFIFSIFGFQARAQNENNSIIQQHTDSVSLSVKPDTLAAVLPDSLPKTPKSPKKLSKDALENSVSYECTDSIYFDFKDKTAVLFQNAKTGYDDMNLEADYIEINFGKNELYASGIATDSGHVHGTPIFTQADSKYRAQEIKYNFTTKKGKITKVITSEGEGYIHGKYVKKIDEKTSFIANGQYTTCDLDCPHYQIKFNKAKAIQNDKIVTGVAYLSFGEIPTFLAIPFGYFPMQKGRASGLVMPTFGISANRGFYFENIGYYLGISDNFDLTLLADIYTRGSWALKAKSNYVFRYKYKGDAFISFAQTLEGERGTPLFNRKNDFKVEWNHQQDPKMNPNFKFSAHIKLISNTYNKNTLSNVNDYLSNQYNSTVSISTNIKGFFFLDASASYSQNTQNLNVNLGLPDLSMSINQIYPFRKTKRVGTPKWYENISVKWSSQMGNHLSGVDSSFFKAETWNNLETGIKHNIPIQIPIKIGQSINWNTSVNITEKWYLQSVTKEFSTDTNDTYISPVITNVYQKGFFALHDVSAQTAVNTKIFFTYGFKRGFIKAIRHVVTPDVSFVYRPNLSGNTYGRYLNTIKGVYEEYYYFSNAMYGNVSSNDQAITRFSISNNLEMKVPSRRDTITGVRKIVILESLTLSGGYDFAADSMRWIPVSISGRSKFTQFLDMTFNFMFDPYVVNNKGVSINKTEWEVNKKLFRFSSSSFQLGVNWRLDNDFFKGIKKEQPVPTTQTPESSTLFTESTLGIPNTRPDFSNPWNVTLNYTFNYNVNENYNYFVIDTAIHYNQSIVQTLGITGDFNITKKWKVGFTTGYDFKAKNFSYTSFDIYRDLHCWEMTFKWIPFGYRRGWSFTINVKASVLKDLKLPLKQDFRDNIF